jgi:hypothetical protein
MPIFHWLVRGMGARTKELGGRKKSILPVLLQPSLSRICFPRQRRAPLFLGSSTQVVQVDDVWGGNHCPRSPERFCLPLGAILLA